VQGLHANSISELFSLDPSGVDSTSYGNCREKMSQPLDPSKRILVKARYVGVLGQGYDWVSLSETKDLRKCEGTIIAHSAPKTSLSYENFTRYNKMNITYILST